MFSAAVLNSINKIIHQLKELNFILILKLNDFSLKQKIKRNEKNMHNFSIRLMSRVSGFNSVMPSNRANCSTLVINLY